MAGFECQLDPVMDSQLSQSLIYSQCLHRHQIPLLMERKSSGFIMIRMTQQMLLCV